MFSYSTVVYGLIFGIITGVLVITIVGVVLKRKFYNNNGKVAAEGMFTFTS